jgi:opacity protein-like surface antigen
MRLRSHAVLVALTLAAGVRPALAAPAAEEAKESGEGEAKDDAKGKDEPKAKDSDDSKKDEDTGHGFQGGLRVGFVFGYKTVFRYPQSPFCRAFDNTKTVSDQQKVCGFLAPPGVELALSFALFDGFEPYIFARFGFAMEKETDTEALQLYGVGARIYTNSDSRLKIYIEPAIALAAEGGAGSVTYALNNPEYKTDLVFHAAAGPQYDFSKLVGIYLDGGLDVGVLRAISANIHLNIGAQVRLP